MAVYTHEQILELLKTNPVFAVGFATDNNFQGVNGNTMKEFGVAFKEIVPLRDFLVAKLKTADWEKAVRAVTTSKYYNSLDAYPIPSAGTDEYATAIKFQPKEYTLGYGEFFNSFIPSTGGTVTKGLSLDSLLAGLGGGLTAYAQAQQAAKDSAAALQAAQNANNTPQAVLDAAKAKADADAAAAKAAEEAEAKRKRTNTIIFVVLGVVVLIIVVAVVVSSNKKPASIPAAA